MLSEELGLQELLKAHLTHHLYHTSLSDSPVFHSLHSVLPCGSPPLKMEVVLKHFRSVVSSTDRSRTPQQLVAVGSRWNVLMESLIKDYMRDATVIITVPKEAALYGGVHQVRQFVLIVPLFHHIYSFSV